MTDKELRKLGRKELLEMLLEQSREVVQLQQELEEARRQLEDRRILLEDSGSIAEAALKLNRVFEAAQEAANQFLESSGAKREVTAQALAEEPTDTQLQAQEILANARQESQQLIEKTRQECAEMLAKTEEECRHMQYEALRRDLRVQMTGSDA